MPAKTAFEKIHVLLQIDPAPGRDEHFLTDVDPLLTSELGLAVFGELNPFGELSLTVTLPVSASPAILSAVQDNPGVLDRAAVEQIHAAIVEHVKSVSGTDLVVSIRHTLLAPAANSLAMPVAMAAV